MVVKGICLIIWMVISLILVFSVVGLVLFVPKDSWVDSHNTPSTWATIGRELLKSIVKD